MAQASLRLDYHFYILILCVGGRAGGQGTAEEPQRAKWIVRLGFRVPARQRLRKVAETFLAQPARGCHCFICILNISQGGGREAGVAKGSRRGRCGSKGPARDSEAYCQPAEGWPLAQRAGKVVAPYRCALTRQ